MLADAAVDVDDALRPFFIPKVTGQDPGQQYVDAHLLLSIARYPQILGFYPRFVLINSSNSFWLLGAIRISDALVEADCTTLHPDEILGNGQGAVELMSDLCARTITL